MENKATIHEVTAACFSITLLFVVLAWQFEVFLLWIMALFGLCINLWIEAFKEWEKGNKYFFSQQLLRGVGLFIFSISLLLL